MEIGELFLFAFFCKTGKFKRIAIVVVSVNKEGFSDSPSSIHYYKLSFV